MAIRKIAVQGSTEIRDANGIVVGLTDRIYSPDDSQPFFDEIFVKGDLSGPLEYNGVRIKIVRVNTLVGLEVSRNGPRGPLWKGVEYEVLN